MADMLDYIQWRGDLSFLESGLNDVDNLIFSRLSYLIFEGIVPHDPTEYITLQEAAQHFFSDESYAQKLILPQDEQLLRALASAPRFQNLRLSGYLDNIDYEKQKQAAAFVIELYKGLSYVAFRGTDNTLVGWKEDFNMCFLSPVPAQETAVSYLNRIFSAITGKFFVGGHSKGGNLAVYASAKCDPAFHRNILAIFSNDAPGFDQAFLKSTEYLSIKARIHTFVPQSSIVGMLLEHEGDYTIVKSTQKGILQHDPFSWQLVGTHFECSDCLTPDSIFLDRSLKLWLSNMGGAEREKFVDALFLLLSDSPETSVLELSANPKRFAKAAISTYKNLDPDMRNNLNRMVDILIKALKNNLPLLFR